MDQPFVIRIEGKIMGGTFVSYLRVSTDKQGRSGLGIEAQRAAVASYLAGFGAGPLAEFVEVESGKRDDRPELARALSECRVRKATLVIAKLDRLARDAHFLLGLQRSGIAFTAADMPNANRLTVGIMAMVAEEGAARYLRPDQGSARRGQGAGRETRRPGGKPEERRVGPAEGGRSSAGEGRLPDRRPLARRRGHQGRGNHERDGDSKGDERARHSDGAGRPLAGRAGATHAAERERVASGA
jgi:DNA invertase Pin-like site-specific DNA recombinase